MHVPSKRSTLFATAIALTIAGGALLVPAADTPTTEPAATTEPVKVDEPYSKLSNLTDDQRVKLDEIHKKATADMKAIRLKEESDSREVLTDDQKAELDKMLAEKKAALSAKNKKRRMTKSETTQPAD